MMSRKVVVQAIAIPTFALFALGSGSKKSEDTGTGAASSASSTSANGAAPGAAGNKVRGHCLDEKLGACTETYSPYGVESDQKLCDTMKGKWTASAECPRKETLWGVCTMREPALPGEATAAIHERIFYYDDGANRLRAGEARASGAAQRKDGCSALTGTWEAGPASAAGAAGTAGASGAAAPAAPKPAKK